MPQGGMLVIETANVTFDEAYTQQQEELAPGDYVEVAARDSGTGMPTEVLKKAFEPFFTTKDVGEGSGLGLSMVYGFVKQSRGHVTIYSEVGHGTTVKLYLPRFQEAMTMESIDDEAPVPASGAELILIVEDNADVREIPVRFLHGQGYKIVTARDGAEAIKHIKSGQAFDLLFTDIVLPGGMNGVEIANEAKRILPNIKVIYTTGSTEYADVHGEQLGPDVTLLKKPYRLAELIAKVRAVLDDGAA